MKGLNIKKLIFVLVGLLLTAATVAYAAEKKEKKIVTPQSAREFLSENTTQKGWEEYVDAKRLITCGTKKCNLDRKVCMTKTFDKGIEVWDTIKDMFGGNTTTYAAGMTLAGAGIGTFVPVAGTAVGAAIGTGIGLTYGVIENAWNNGATSVRVTRYECISKTEQASFEKQGYKVTETGGKETKTSTNKSGSKTSTEGVDQKLCYTASSTKGNEVSQYCLVLSGDTVVVVGAKEDGKNECEVIPVQLYYQQRCTFCFLMGGIFATADKITVRSYSKLGKSFAIVIVLGLALWIAMKTLVFVSSMTKQDAAKYITEMIKQSYKFAIAYFVLYYYGDVFRYIINPLLTAGFDFGNAFSLSNVPMPRPELFGSDAVVDTKRSINDLLALGQNMPSDFLLNSDNIYFRFPLYVQLEHFVYNVNLSLSTLQVIGKALGCRGLNFLLDWTNWGLSIPCLIYAAVFWVFGFLLSFAFIFYVLDAIVQLGIVGALLPFLIASWPFKITSKWTSTGFKMLLNSIFTFMLMGMVSRVIIELIDQAVQANSDSGDSGLAELVEALDTVDIGTLKSMINVLSVGFCLFIFTNLIGFLLMGRVSELVNKFAEGGMKPVAPGAATIATSAVKGAAAKLAAPTLKAAEKGFDRMGKNLGKKLGGFIFGTRRKSPAGGGGAPAPTVQRGGANAGAGGAPTVQRNGGGQNGRRPKV